MASKTKSSLGAKANGRRQTGARPASRTRASRSSAPARTPARTRAARGRGVPHWVTPVAIAALIIVAAWSFYPVARVQYQEQRDKAKLEAELSALKDRNSKLRADVERLKTPEGVEEAARESLGYVKQGEDLYVVLDGTEKEATPTTQPDTAPVSQDVSTGWGRLLDMVFGVR